MKILHLTIKKKFFDMIASGEKKEEYREIKSYWVNRFLSDFSWDINLHPIKINADKDVINKGSFKVKEYTHVCLKNGYSKTAPTVLIEWLGTETGKAKPEWSDNWQGEVFVIKLGDIIPNPQH